MSESKSKSSSRLIGLIAIFVAVTLAGGAVW